MLGIDGTCSASTCKSGSDIVMMKPRMKPIAMMSSRFLLLVIAVPTRSPIGVMLISAPSVKNMMPTTIMAAPIRKHSRMLAEIGAMVKHRTITIAITGSTARSASDSFSLRFARECFNVSTAILSVLGISILYHTGP